MVVFRCPECGEIIPDCDENLRFYRCEECESAWEIQRLPYHPDQPFEGYGEGDPEKVIMLEVKAGRIEIMDGVEVAHE